jgi:hypothetical protein
VGKALGWKAGRCWRAQVSELFSMEICVKAVMDYRAATDVGKFPPNEAWRPEGPVFLFQFHFHFYFSSLLLSLFLSFVSGDAG